MRSKTELSNPSDASLFRENAWQLKSHRSRPKIQRLASEISVDFHLYFVTNLLILVFFFFWRGWIFVVKDVQVYRNAKRLSCNFEFNKYKWDHSRHSTHLAFDSSFIDANKRVVICIDSFGQPWAAEISFKRAINTTLAYEHRIGKLFTRLLLIVQTRIVTFLLKFEASIHCP